MTSPKRNTVGLHQKMVALDQIKANPGDACTHPKGQRRQIADSVLPMRSGQIEDISVHKLRVNPRNARTHSKKQVRQIAESILKFGFTNPVLTDAQNTIIAGHGRVLAAAQLGLETVPCIRLEGMTPDEKRAYVIADNKLALNAGWDDQILAEELQALLTVDLDFDIGITGFSIPEIDRLIEELSPEEMGDPEDDRLPDLGDGPPVSCPGDLWELGPHRLICGSALEPETYAKLLAGELAQAVITDPPYNLAISVVGGSGKIHHPEFVMASGEMSAAEFTTFLTTALKNLATHSADGSIHFIFMDFRHMQEVLSAGSAAYTELKNLCIWVKDNGGMGTFYRSRHELVFVFKKGTAPHINTFELGQHGRYRTNVWEYRGVNTLRAGRMDELALHPTVKPVAMIADAIKDVSRRNGIVLDVFGGSGSTLIAAHKTGRKAFLAELDPIYVDRIIRRWQVYAHDDALLASTGERFDDTMRARQQKQSKAAYKQGDANNLAPRHRKARCPRPHHSTGEH
jgi:DNA modification methylase